MDYFFICDMKIRNSTQSNFKFIEKKKKNLDMCYHEFYQNLAIVLLFNKKFFCITFPL